MDRLACPRERTGGKLATLTALNSIVNVCYAKVPRCAVSHKHGVAMAFSGSLFVTRHRRNEKNALNFEESAHGSASAVQEPASADQNC